MKTAGMTKIEAVAYFLDDVGNRPGAPERQQGMDMIGGSARL